MRKIEITIDDEGQTKIEAFGYKGGTCEKATAPLKKALIGQSPDSSTKKPEYYQGNVTTKVKESA